MNRPRAEHALPDKRAVRRAFDRARAFDDVWVVHDEARGRLMERLDFFRVMPELVVDLGCGTGRGLCGLAARYPGARILGVDASGGVLGAAYLTSAGASQRTVVLGGDAEALPLKAASVQLLFANLCLPFCRPDRVFAEAARVLADGGLFVFSTVGPDTLQEVRRAWLDVDDGVHVHAAFDMHDLGDLALASGLAEPVLDVDRLEVTYPDPAALVRDLRGCGAVNTAAGRRRGLTGVSRWRAFERGLVASGGSDGRFAVTVELVLGQAWGRGRAQSSRAPSHGEVEVPIEKIGRRSRG